MTTRARILGTVWAMLVVARHLALLVFAFSVALAAWPPAGRLSTSVAGRSFSVWFDGRRLVAEATAGRADVRGTFGPSAAPPGRGPAAAVHFLPAGVILEHAGRGPASVRLTVPAAAHVAATGLLWLATLLPGGPRRGASHPAPATGELRRESHRDAPEPAGPSPRRGLPPLRLRRTRSALWRFRYATGSLLVAAAWLAVYTLPRDTGGLLFSDVQALHVACAAFAVCGATMLITFD